MAASHGLRSQNKLVPDVFWDMRLHARHLILPTLSLGDAQATTAQDLALAGHVPLA